MKRKSKRKINIIVNIVFYLIIGVSVLISFTVLIGKFSNDVPSILGNKLFTVVSGSMEPTIRVGSLVIVREVDVDKLSVLDVITFNHIDSHKVVTHRIVKINKINGELQFTTRGDANDTDDYETVIDQNIIGKVAFSIPFLGSIFMFANSKTGIFLLLIIPGGLLIIYESKKIYDYVILNKREKEAEKQEEKNEDEEPANE